MAEPILVRFLTLDFLKVTLTAALPPAFTFAMVDLLIKIFTLKYKNEGTNLTANLIIVPHKLIPQWSENFSKSMTASPSVLYSKTLVSLKSSVV